MSLKDDITVLPSEVQEELNKGSTCEECAEALSDFVVKLEADNALLKKDADAYKLYISEQEAEKAILLDALKMLWNDISGGDKKCGHNFSCVCAGDNTRKVLNRLTTNRGES